MVVLATVIACAVWIESSVSKGDAADKSFRVGSAAAADTDRHTSSEGTASDETSLDSAIFDISLRRREENVAPMNSTTNESTSRSMALTSNTGFRLVATIIEPGHSYAMITDRDGALETCQLGSELKLRPSGFYVEKIESRSVIVTSDQNRERLTLQRVETEPDGARQRFGIEKGADSQPKNGANDRPRGMKFDGEIPRGGFDSIESELEWLSGPDSKENQASGRDGSKGSSQ